MKRRIAIALLALCGAVSAAAPAAAQGYGESPYIFGVHDPEGAPHMADKRKGWILFTEELGRDANNASGRDYRPWADQGFGIIVRLNHGYGPTSGTLPYAKHYAAFAQRASRFVAASPGAHIWIVGNEMNWDQEWPRYEGTTEEITPDRYVQAFRQVRSAIRTLPGHAGDQVIPGALGTYGPPTAGGLSFVQYHVRVLELLGAGGLDAIAVHTYTHGPDPALVVDEAHMGPPYEAYHYNFRAYRDYLNAHPAWARSLPVYITETDQVGPWEDANRGWVRAAYGEIDEWNRGVGNQKDPLAAALPLLLRPVGHHAQGRRDRRLPPGARQRLPLDGLGRHGARRRRRRRRECGRHELRAGRDPGDARARAQHRHLDVERRRRRPARHRRRQQPALVLLLLRRLRERRRRRSGLSVPVGRSGREPRLLVQLSPPPPPGRRGSRCAW